MLNRTLVPFLLVASFAGSGCGSDDQAASADASAKAPATTPAEAATTPAEASASTAAVAADGEITVKAAEMSFAPSSITAKPGKLKITLDNAGTMEHELVVLKTDAAPDSLPVAGGQVNEDDSVGEIAEVAAGASASHTFDLKPGHYVIVCNVPGHYAAGMRGELVVE